MLSVRPAVRADVPLILSLIRELADYEREPHAVVAGAAEIEAALFAEAPKVFCDIAEWNGAPAGFALWFYNFSTWRGRHGLYLEDLFVRPAFRANGIGRSLLALLARRCVEQRLDRMEWSVLAWNELALGVYRGVGAEVMEEWRTCRLSGEALGRLAAQAPG
jgi:diamine N-acetyltransferase